MTGTRSAGLGAALLLVVLFATPLSAGGSREQRDDDLQVRGRILISGNEPLTFPAINLESETAGYTSFRLEGALADELSDSFQQKIVTIRVRVTEEAVGPGRPAVAEVLEIIDAP